MDNRQGYVFKFQGSGEETRTERLHDIRLFTIDTYGMTFLVVVLE